MIFARSTPRFAASGGVLFAAMLLGCSGSPSDPEISGSGGLGGLPGVGGQSNGGTSAGQGGTNNGNGGTTSQQQGGNGTGGAQQGGSSAGGVTSSGGATTGGATNRGGSTSTGGVSNNGGSATGGKATTGGAANVGGTATGGKATTGGAANVGGTATGGKATTGGAMNVGGMATGGKAATGGAATGGAATGGAATGGATAAGGATSTGSTFSQCRFHFGTIDSKAKSGGTSMISQLDFFTPGWMLGSAFDQSYVCTEGNTGGALASLVPVVVAYVAAGNVKRDHNLCDCNVSGCSGGDLCQYGSQYIVQDWTKIINVYKSYSAGYAACYGTTKPIIFEMEPDWYQYTGTSQSSPWTAAQAASRMAELVAALKTGLPNARFSIDASPWVAPNNGSDSGATWFANFNMSLFTFVNTSGGGTNANTAKIRSSNNMTWAGLGSASGKPILADTGYGANGVSAGHDPNWDEVANINARIADGVVSIAQYNPNTTWGTTISGIRSQLSTPKYCP
jgi:hypothetical protein